MLILFILFKRCFHDVYNISGPNRVTLLLSRGWKAEEKLNLKKSEIKSFDGEFCSVNKMITFKKHGNHSFTAEKKTCFLLASWQKLLYTILQSDLCKYVKSIYISCENLGDIHQIYTRIISSKLTFRLGYNVLAPLSFKDICDNLRRFLAKKPSIQFSPKVCYEKGASANLRMTSLEKRQALHGKFYTWAARVCLFPPLWFHDYSFEAQHVKTMSEVPIASKLCDLRSSIKKKSRSKVSVTSTTFPEMINGSKNIQEIWNSQIGSNIAKDNRLQGCFKNDMPIWSLGWNNTEEHFLIESFGAHFNETDDCQLCQLNVWFWATVPSNRVSNYMVLTSTLPKNYPLSKTDSLFICSDQDHYC